MIAVQRFDKRRDLSVPLGDRLGIAALRCRDCRKASWILYYLPGENGRGFDIARNNGLDVVLGRRIRLYVGGQGDDHGTLKASMTTWLVKNSSCVALGPSS